MSLTKYIKSTLWAMTDEGLDTVISMADKEPNFQIIEKKIGTNVEGSNKVKKRGSVGIISLHGPLMKRDHLFAEILGATSYDLALRDLNILLEDRSVHSIVLDIDSPGGEVNGCQELAEHVFRARSTKPIFAYVGDLGASAAYWIASACTKVYASETAILGSIGVQRIVRNSQRKDEISFISSQSPLKNQDPTSEPGSRKAQEIIDDLASVFINCVARNRNVDHKKVKTDFGRGGVFIAAEAMKRNMIDEICTLEDLLVDDDSNTEIEDKTESTNTAQELTIEILKEKHPKLVSNLNEEATLLERKRVSDLYQSCKGKLTDSAFLELMDSGAQAGDPAIKILLNDESRAKHIPFTEDASLSGLSSNSPDSGDEWDDTIIEVKGLEGLYV